MPNKLCLLYKIFIYPYILCFMLVDVISIGLISSCLHIGHVDIANTPEAELEYEKVTEEYEAEVLIDDVPKSPADLV